MPKPNMCEPNKISYTANPMNGIRRTIQNKPKMVVMIEPPKRKGQKLGVPSQKTFSFWSKTLSNSLIVLFVNVYNYNRLIKKFSSPKIKIWFEPMFFSGFFCGFERFGSADNFPAITLCFLFEGGIAFCNFASLRQNGNKFFFGGQRTLKNTNGQEKTTRGS